MASLQPLFNLECIRQIRLICKHDVGHLTGSFDRRLWSKHISNIYPVLARNFWSHGNKKINLVDILGAEPEILFPARSLRDAETSLICKHYYSLSLVDDVTLTIEDDALLRTDSLPVLADLIGIAEYNDCYIDLGSLSGLEKCGKSMLSSLGHRIYVQPIGLTRTTAAYLINPNLAALLANTYWPCALPADLHHQRLLWINEINGLWPEHSIFDNLSILGVFPSTI